MYMMLTYAWYEWHALNNNSCMARTSIHLVGKEIQSQY
jgi:hypothetical protein